MIAIEMTECYKMDKKDFWHCLTTYEEFADRVGKKAKETYDIMKAKESEDDDDQDLDVPGERKDVLSELKRGKILFHGRKRQVITKK